MAVNSAFPFKTSRKAPFNTSRKAPFNRSRPAPSNVGRLAPSSPIYTAIVLLCTFVLLCAFALLCNGCDFLPKRLKVKPSTQGVVAVSLKQVHAEILREMMKAVLLKDTVNQSLYLGYLNSLDQGASVEGIYNGLTHSDDYRQLEQRHAGVLPVALDVFCDELLRLEASAVTKTEFNAQSAEPLGQPVALSLSPTLSGAARVAESNPPPPAQFQRVNCTQLFSASSLYTLKRVLGDEALKILDEKKTNSSERAEWYGKWVSGFAKRKFDFGLALRNNSDEKFHKVWALRATEDSLTWEVLNRTHRLLNVYFVSAH